MCHSPTAAHASAGRVRASMRRVLRFMRGSVCVIVVSAAAAGLVACGGSGDGGGSGKASGSASTSLDIRIPDDPADLDPQKGLSTIGLQFSYYLYDTLVDLDKNGQPIPKLATKWDVTPTSLKLTIRDDITCSDGSKMTPSVIKANLDRIKDPRTRAPYVENFLGSTRYTVAADDAAGTVLIKLPEPYTPLLGNLAQYPPMICQAAIDNPKQMQSRSFGTGPFVLKEKVVNDHYTLTARDGYRWGPNGATTAAEGFPREVTVRVVPNDTTAANQLETGELDLSPITGPERERLQQNDGLTYKDAPSGVSVIHFNEARGRPGADPALRKALVQAIDREAMTQSGYGAFGRVTGTVILPGSQCYADDADSSIPAFDPDAAAKVISAAAPTLKFISIAAKDGEYAAEAWKQAGAKVEMKDTTEAGEGLGIVFGGGDWDATLFSWDGATNTSGLLSYLDGPVPPDGTNFASIDNQEFVREAKLAQAAEGEQSCAKETAAQAALNATGDMVPVNLKTIGYYAQDGVDFDTFFGAVDPSSLRAGG